MTNFQAKSDVTRLRWLTPERAVLLLPIAAGLVAAVALVSFAVVPLTLRVQQKRQQVDGLRRLRDELPLLQAQLLASRRQLDQRRQQQQALLELVAGVNELDTFLAELNNLADQMGVTLTMAEPGEIQVYQPPAIAINEQDAPPPAAGGEGAEPADPLLKNGLERRSAEIGVSGTFNQLLAFMRALESLQVFVQTSDLVLMQPSNSSTKDEIVPTPVLDLTLTLSAYGPQAEDLNSPTNLQ